MAIYNTLQDVLNKVWTVFVVNGAQRAVDENEE